MAAPMLSAWLQQQDNVASKGVPSWSVLRAALKRMGAHKLANRISTDGEYSIIVTSAVCQYPLYCRNTMLSVSSVQLTV